jgi:crossover junction endodeoxyribonuclease RuvC
MPSDNPRNSFTMHSDIIIGVDPGTNITGYGIICMQSSECQVLDYGCIRPPPRLKITDRYLIIYNGLKQLLEKYKPRALAVETQFVHKNVQSAIKLGMARGIVIIAAKSRGMAVIEYAPSRAKYAISKNGRASKHQVQAMVKQLLNLDAIPEPEDAADALALALCLAHDHRFSMELGTEI